MRAHSVPGTRCARGHPNEEKSSLFKIWGKNLNYLFHNDATNGAGRISPSSSSLFAPLLTQIVHSTLENTWCHSFLLPLSEKSFGPLCMIYILIETARDKMRMRVWRVHSSRLLHSRPVFISSRSSRRLVGKSVPIQRKLECLECLASLSMILARECECLYSCVLHLVRISP